MIQCFRRASFEQYLSKANLSETGIFRKVFNSSEAASMQFMLIAFKPFHSYNFICDHHQGFIAFTCLYGQLKITSFYKKNETTHMLNPGDIIYLPRWYWRKTESGKLGAIFTESIEGDHSPSYRQKFNKSNEGSNMVDENK